MIPITYNHHMVLLLLLLVLRVTGIYYFCRVKNACLKGGRTVRNLK